MPAVTQIARAKINLTLHVGPPESSHLHMLHSLVVFADIGDDLSAEIADEFSLEIDGPFASGLPSGDDNLILKAVKDNALINGVFKKLAIKLTKKLPISSGIGGGSADAGAAVRLLAILNNEPALTNDYLLVELGADVPVCHLSKTCLMESVGEELTPLPDLGQIPAILVNPGVPVSTAEIFKAFDKDGLSSKFELPQGSLVEMAQAGRNDLQDIAIRIAPVIQDVLDIINAQKGRQLARMSGSGATCFGLFETFEQAKQASAAIKNEHPNWWCVPTMLGDMREGDMP